MKNTEKNAIFPSVLEKVFSEAHEIFNVEIKESGWEVNTPSKGFGPYVREYYIMHFVVDGKGVYEIENKTYTVQKNQIFLIPPKIPTRYYADDTTPWKYFWIGFNTKYSSKLLELCGFSNDCLVQSFKEIPSFIPSLAILNRFKHNHSAYEQLILGVFLQIIGIIIGEKSKESSTHTIDSYITSAIAFMKNNFTNKTTINDVARYVGLERTYFSKVFFAHTGISPKNYLQNLRLDYSRTLLSETEMPSNEIALNCGFNDYSHFYKAFLNKYEITPKFYRDYYRKEKHNEQNDDSKE